MKQIVINVIATLIVLYCLLLLFYEKIKRKIVIDSVVELSKMSTIDNILAESIRTGGTIFNKK